VSTQRITAGNLSEKIDRRVEQASHTGISAERIHRYAHFLVAAETEAKWESMGAEHTRRSTFEIAGELYGLEESGYWNDGPARQARGRGRKTRQAIDNAADGARRAIERLKDLVIKSQSDLPVHMRIATGFSPERLDAALELLKEMKSFFRLRDDRLSEAMKSHGRPVVVNQTEINRQAYLWWLSEIGDYPEKWKEMYALARTWRLSDADSVENFRRYVRKVSREMATNSPK
jgi:hypothetical protein